MFIENIIINDFNIYIKRTQNSIDIMYQYKDNKAISFVNYGNYFSIKLYEYNGKLYFIRRSNASTIIVPIYINEEQRYATTGSIPLGFDVSRYLNDDIVEKYIKNYR